VTVSKEITRLEHSRVKLALTIGKDDVQSEYDKILKDFSKDIQLPGFRKGKVPKTVIERKFGDALTADITGRVIEEALETAFQDESFAKEDLPLAYSQPELENEPENLQIDKDYTFTVVYDVFPNITIGQYKGLEIEVPDVKITDEDIAKELETLRERNAVVLDKDEAATAAHGDVATVNYCELDDTGAVIEKTDRQDFVFTIGSGRNIFKFDEDIVGMKKGESKDIEKTYAEDFEDKDLAGKTKKIRVTLTALKEKKLPDLDDDLAQDVDEKFSTLDDLKNDIREKLGKNMEHRLEEAKINKLLSKIIETTPIDIPEAMMRIQLDAQWRNFGRQIGMDAETLKENVSKSEKGLGDFEALWRPEAERALHSRLIIEILMRDLNLSAGDEDIEKEMAKMAEETGEPLEEIKKFYEQDEAKSYLENDIKERKLYDMLLAENTVKIGSSESLDAFLKEQEKKA
jgi:trigger factor